MTQEIPLSLQVFHSSNEYKAHRMNRTEQLRLDDVRAVLQREEKLYVKEYVIHKNKFNSHHRCALSSLSSDRRNSVASSSVLAPSCFSRTSSSGAYSAPGKLQRTSAKSNNPALNSSLASQLCTSLNRLSTSTRFQRMQRQFSLASFTQNGLITKKGMTMSKNIPKARDILFRRKKTINLGMNSYAQKLDRTCESVVSGSDKNETHTKAVEHIQEEEDNQDSNRKELQETEVTLATVTKANLEQNEDSGEGTRMTTTVVEEDESLPVEKLYLTGTVIEHPDRGTSTDLPRDPPKTPKKRATIKNEVDVQTNFNAVSRLSPIISGCDNNGGDEDTTDWSSVFSRPGTAPKSDPLQERINSFLVDQDDFNRAFPKSYDVNPEINDLQTELAHRARARKEMKKRDNKKKNEIVVEVLTTLGVDDPHIIAHYDVDNHVQT